MDRKNRDFSKGPVWSSETTRWLVEIRYPDGSRIRKRIRREREALRFWASEHARIENGTWDERASRNVTVGVAMAEYREYSKVQHRAHRSFVAPSCTLWEQHLGSQTPLAKVTSQQIEDYKLKRARQVSRSTTDKDLTVLKAFFNWCISHRLAVSNPVRRVKLFHEDNSRLRYLTREEYDRLIDAARTLASRSSVSTPSPYLVEKIVLAAHTGLRRGSLFNLRWDQIDLANRVLRIPRTKSGRPLSVPINLTARGVLETLYADRDPVCPWVFPHRSGPTAGEPVQDIKNGFHAALALAGIQDFTWHDLRHTFASWLMMRGASLRSVAELLGHQSMKMTMRYAHLSPAFLSAEVGLLDAPPEDPAEVRLNPGTTYDGAVRLKPNATTGNKSKRARKGQSASIEHQIRSEVPEFVREFGSSGWIRTSNPPVNSRMLCR
jgi:integrase